MSVSEKASRLLKDYRPEHSEFQMEHFIVGSDGHPWPRYKQALRELSARHRGVIESGIELSAMLAELKRERAKCFLLRSSKKIAALESNIESAKEKRRPKVREYVTFYSIALGLKRKIGEVNAARRRELEAESWAEKARKMAAIDLLSIGGLQRNTVEFIVSMPRDVRRRIIEDLRPQNRQRFLQIIE